MFWCKLCADMSIRTEVIEIKPQSLVKVGVFSGKLLPWMTTHQHMMYLMLISGCPRVLPSFWCKLCADMPIKTEVMKL